MPPLGTSVFVITTEVDLVGVGGMLRSLLHMTGDTCTTNTDGVQPLSCPDGEAEPQSGELGMEP